MSHQCKNCGAPFRNHRSLHNHYSRICTMAMELNETTEDHNVSSAANHDGGSESACGDISVEEAIPGTPDEADIDTNGSSISSDESIGSVNEGNVASDKLSEKYDASEVEDIPEYMTLLNLQPEVGVDIDEAMEDLTDPNDTDIVSGPQPTLMSSAGQVHPVEAELLYLMTKYSIPASSYNEFIGWAKNVHESDYDFSNAKCFRTIVQRVLSQRGAEHAKVKSATVKVGRIPEQTLFYFSFVENLKRLFNDDKLMSGAVWEYHSNSATYSEMNTGSWWQHAEWKMRESLTATKEISDFSDHVLVPIILFIDATHLDRNSRLKAEPILMSIGNILLDLRKHPLAWCLLGLLPNKILTPEEEKAESRGTGLCSDSLLLYHQCIGVVLK